MAAANWDRRMHLLGIDIGTGGTRAIVIDDQGKIIASATEEHAAFQSLQPGWAEQDPGDWWRACVVAVRTALKRSGIRSEQVAAVGFSGQMHGAVLLDKEDGVIRRALIWCDQRTQKQVEELSQSFGTDRLIRLTCNRALTNFTLTKLLWVRDNEPQNWRRISSLMLPKDYVRFRLTGERGMDMSDASGTLMLDVANRRWSDEVLRETEIPKAFLPSLFESVEVCGRVSSSGAEATGLCVGTRVVAGAGDQAAGAVGMGIVKPGVVSATIGTSGVVFAATDHPALDKLGRIHTFCHAVPGRWHVMGVTQAAGLSLRWFRDQFCNRAVEYEHLTQEAIAVPPGANGLFWAPYLMGERTPYCDPTIRGGLVGLSATHTRADAIRAILEGVAFSLKDTLSIFEEMEVPIRSLRFGGGGARSDLWRQIQADTYGKEAEIVEAEEGAAYGAALLAGVGSRVWKTVEEACDMVIRVLKRVMPDANASAVMQRNYNTYRRLYPALRSILEESSQSSRK